MREWSERVIQLRGKHVVRLFLLGMAASAALSQNVGQPQWSWLPPAMGNPSKLSADRFVNDEAPSMTRDDEGRIWVAWYSCRTSSTDLPQNKTDLAEWQWTEDGEDVIVTRWFDGENWSSEETVSSEPGVNWKPVVVADEGGVRILWTSRRNGKWAAYERRWRDGKWGAESAIPGGAGAIEIDATRLSNGDLLAVMKKLAPPRLELQAVAYRGGAWQEPVRLDEAQGRCQRVSIQPLPRGEWLVAWDEERAGDYDIWVRGSNSAVQRITDTRVWDTTPTLARTSDGLVWLAWERKEAIGGRFAYKGRSIFAKTWDGLRWNWAPSPFSEAEPGRLTRHSRFWATGGISEERYPHLQARRGGDLWLFWLGGGRNPSTSFVGRRWKDGRWREPQIIFNDPVPYSTFSLPSVERGVDLRQADRGPYQTPLCDQMTIWLDDPAGEMWMAYEVAKRRNTTDRMETASVQARSVGYGADIYTHRVDLEEREYRFPTVGDDQSPIAPLEPRPHRPAKPRSIEIGGEQYKLVFGDVHGHTEHDAIGTVDMYYAHGLLIAGMDFLANTNHDYSPDLVTQSEWAQAQSLATVYNAIDERVAFSGYEWTTDPADARGGHRAMYFLADTGELRRSTTVASNTVEKLFQSMRGQDVILQPHHNGWEGYDPDLQPVLEVTSAWRQLREESTDFKAEGKVQSAWEALERGYRIGFVGSGDTHWLAPGEDYGITGAYVKELTREGVFEAIRARRVFASTGERLVMDFRVNGEFIGGETTASGSARIAVKIEGEGEIDSLQIVRDHHVIYAARGEGNTVALEFLDKAERPDGRTTSYYYLRVRMKDSMLAWSSPIWVNWR